jgi:serine/threonine protein phosphatase PrpC/CRP-like cAMP-binding protein
VDDIARRRFPLARDQAGRFARPGSDLVSLWPVSSEPNRLTAWAQTSVGRVRDHNEDAYLLDEELCLYAVADGMGGHAAGEVASNLTLQVFKEKVAEAKQTLTAFTADPTSRDTKREVLRVLEEAVHAACTAVHEAGREDEQKRGMGTTLCALLVIGSHGFIAHVGDSRIYLVRGDKTHQLTQDHTLQNELLKRGRLSAEEISRVAQKNALTRAIGVYASVDVDTLDLDILNGDRFLLCSDGLYSYLRKGELSSILEGGSAEAPQRLIALSNERGGHDNITAIVLSAGESGEEQREQQNLAQLKLETLQAVPIFRFLNYQELVKVGSLTDVRHFVADEPIFKEGDEGDELFVVLTGGVRVHKNGQTLVELGQGEHFGEMALVDREPRSATVNALQDTRLLVMKRADFFHIIKYDRDMAVKLLWQFLGVITERLRSTSRELGEARGRLATEEMLPLNDEDLEEAS